MNIPVVLNIFVIKKARNRQRELKKMDMKLNIYVQLILLYLSSKEKFASLTIYLFVTLLSYQEVNSFGKRG